jgi:O-antigen/teichoic acid export membrane protein
LFARGDGPGINELYWRTAIWIAVVSSPLFALTVSLARPLTLLLFGSRYEDAASLLAVIAIGNYFNAALGFNAYTLRVYGKVRYLVAMDAASALLTLAGSLLLVSRYGAMGAALAVSGSLIVYNLLTHAGLLLGTHVDLFDRRYISVYAAISILSIILFVVNHVFAPPIAVSVALTAAASLLLVRMHRRELGVHEMFPELLRIRVLRPLLGV